MWKFSEMLILVCRKIFSTFYLILHETFSNSYGFPFMQEFNPFYLHLVLYDGKHFCSVLTDSSNLWFLFHQKFPLLSYDVKNVLTKQFPKIQKHLFANVLQKQSPRGVLRNFKKFTGKHLCQRYKCFPLNITKIFVEHLQWLLLNIVEEFLRISNLT